MGIYLLALVAKRVLEGELYTLSSKDLLLLLKERAPNGSSDAFTLGMLSEMCSI